MHLKPRRSRQDQAGKLFISTGAILALTGSFWWHHVRSAPLTNVDSETLEIVQIETPHGRSNKRFMALMMIASGGAIVAIGRLLRSESRF